MLKHRKNRKILKAASLLPELLPCIVLIIGIMLLGCDICSLFPLYSTMSILIITYAILFLPYTAEYVISARYLAACPQSAISSTKKTLPCGRAFSFSGC